MFGIGFPFIINGSNPAPAPAPIVTSIDYDVGDTAGGTPVTITGENFTSATGATVGGVFIDSFVVVNDTTITGVTGAHAKGNVPVAVLGPGGTGTSATNIYEYFNPTSIAKCVWWLRADLGITLNGSTEVTAWADQSGIGDANRNQITTGLTDHPAYNASDPNYNGKATIGPFNKAGANNDCRFNGAGTWNATYAAYTLGCVGHTIATSNRYMVYGNSTNYRALLNVANVPRFYVGNNSTFLSGGSGLSTAKCVIVGKQANGGTSALYLNSLTTAAVTGTINTDLLGASAGNIGSFPGAAATFGTERVAEVWAFSPSPDAGEDLRMTKYLNGRYNKTMT